MIKQSRNDPCHCGSGKKFKVCHGQAAKSFNQQWVIAGVLGGIFLLFFFMDSETSTMTTTNSSIPTSVVPQPGTSVATPQPGEAPPGKVWSPEHGHWHDIAGIPAGTVPDAASNLAQPGISVATPQPGEAPPGKVWSPEHGHWHDIQ